MNMGSNPPSNEVDAALPLPWFHDDKFVALLSSRIIGCSAILRDCSRRNC